jgi:ParB family transcriptional regulator, chromosome partitioning protein
MQFKAVPLTEIDLQDETYRSSLADPDEPLRQSLRQAGILHPPLLRRASSASRYQILCGFRRALCARQLGWDQLPAIIMDTPEEADPRECLLRNYRENRLERDLHLCEKSQLVDKLLRLAGLTADEVVDTFLPELQLPANLATLDRLQRMHRWPREMQQAAFGADLASQPLLRLADSDAQDAAAVIELLCRYRWSHSRQKEVLGYLLDLSAARGATLRSVIQEALQLAGLQDPHTPRPQRAEALRRHLRRLRFPRLTGAEERYAELRQALRLGPQISFEEPPDFEGDRYRIEFRFGNRQEYLHALQQLQQAAGVPEFDELFNLL